ncbi:hypothetical protein OFN16_20455 [Escherichia coli]|uniref:hypothetical protein n=2 Tax=Escherichia coli TaxID=562 RepID=UPI0016598074|nr:hypothetical protein [Escherichia coli]EEW3542013.1 hypothetical protein [Escherichia coli]EFA6201226.1 hypothetical protein [Escherichia coli]EFA6355920.1 hypothetical protein [Escherichia coli]EFA6445951.1 hypothetical protein [Escherichia coli]EFA6450718.1 hypothetical protein [Escherichia coli]
MNAITKGQLIEDLKASTQNSSGMFEIGEDTICALMYLLADTPELVYVPDVAYSDDCPDLYPSQPDAWAEGWNSCRAAMLQGGNHTEQHLEMVDHSDDANKMVAGNSPVIPNGWKLVPIDPTKDMLRAGQSVVGFWLNTVHCYSKMLAAAPAAPQQEAKNV